MTDGVQLGLAANPTVGTITRIERHGDLYLKRDDTFEIAGVQGGKVRVCWELARHATGLVTAGSRQSPQVNIVAQIARHLDVPCRVHTPTGALSPELLDAQEAGAEVVQHVAGYNSVIIRRARDDAQAKGWTLIPFGMECGLAAMLTSRQVKDIPPQVKRIVVPVGSGMSLAGILWGLTRRGPDIPVLGIMVGADPTERLTKYAPGWRLTEPRLTLIHAPQNYHKNVVGEIDGIILDPVY